MTIRSFDAIVLGQGLAGSAVAWTLHWAGFRVLVIDRPVAATASRVAAGLVTPVTGQRLAVSWKFTEFWPIALDFYRKVERVTCTSLFREIEMVRMLATEAEQSQWERRRHDGVFCRLTKRPVEPPLNPDDFLNSEDSFEMFPAGQLDVPVYLDATREWFLKRGLFLEADVATDESLSVSGKGIRLTSLDVTASRMVLCQGLAAIENSLTGWLPFQPARGDVLTVRIPGLTERRIVHRGVWLAHLEEDLFRVGATYRWEWRFPDLASARKELITQLRGMLRMPVEVVSQSSAVRPILKHQRPVVSALPDHPHLFLLNGLGSKGVLQAPLLSWQLSSLMAATH